MKKVIWITFGIIFLNVFLFSEIKIISKTKDYITVQVDFKNYKISKSKDFTIVNAKEWEFNGNQQAPNLPIKELNVIVPPNGSSEIKILQTDSIEKEIEKPIEPVATPIPDGKTFNYVRKIDREKYKNFPSTCITIKKNLMFRFYKFNKVVITPIIIKNDGKKLKIYKKILFKIRISGDKNYHKSYFDKFSDIYSEIFINYDEMKFCQFLPKTNVKKFDFSRSNFWYKFQIDNFGLNLLTNKALKVIPNFADYNTFRLFKSYKNKKNEYIYKEIPIKILNGEILFKNNLEDDRKIMGSTVFYLTFGGNFNTPILRSGGLKKSKNIYKIKELTYLKLNKIEKNKEQADCIIIYPSVFLSMAEELKDFQNSEMGINTAIIKQEDIIDQYGGGYADISAIRDFLEDAFYNWDSPKIQYVILLGSGTNVGLDSNESITLQDWYNITTKNKILVAGNGIDDYYVRFNGAFPQLSIARIPCKTRQEFDIYFPRMKNYYTNLPDGWWQDKITILADDELHKGGYEGGVNDRPHFNHSYYAQRTQMNLPNTIIVDKVMAINYPLDEYNTKPQAKEEFIKRVNEGRLITYYIGHGNQNVMGDESYFELSDIGKLNNEEHLTYWIAASCEVGRFYDIDYDSVGDRILFGENGGAIATLSASWKSVPKPNYNLILQVLKRSFIYYDNLGKALLNAKMVCGNYGSNNYMYNIFGNPMLKVVPPKIKGEIIFQNMDNSTTIQLQKREKVLFDGEFDAPVYFNEAQLKVFAPHQWVTYINPNYVVNDSVFKVNYTLDSNEIYRGKVTVDENKFHNGFIIPQECVVGDSAKVLSYAYDEETNERVLSVKERFIVSDEVEENEDSNKPQINIWVDSERFKPGDPVSTSPTIYAEISDENGINITGEPGRKILLLLKNPNGNESLLDLTDSFNYDVDSFTQGHLSYKLSNLSVGIYNVTLYAYDNFGNWNQKETYFKVKKSTSVKIYQDLPYPNPMGKEGGKFTFLLSEEADVILEIYTITGKKIKKIKKYGLSANYNEIEWDGRDEDGDFLANGTYFYKLKAITKGNGKSFEKIGKFIIEK